MADEKRTSTKLMAVVKTSADLAKKHAIVKKMESMDLTAIHARIGAAILEKDIRRAELEGLFTKINEVDRDIEAKRDADHSATSTATMSEKVACAAKAAKDKAGLEALLYRRKGVVQELGAAAMNLEFDDTEITALQAEERSKRAEIEDIKNDIANLESKSGFVGKHPFLICGAILVVLVVPILWITGMLDRRSDFEKQMALVEAQQEKQRIESEKRAKERQEQLELKLAKDKLRREKELEERKEKREAERIAREEKLRAERLAREKEQAELEEKRRAERIAKEEKLKAERLAIEKARKERQEQYRAEQARKIAERQAEAERREKEAAEERVRRHKAEQAARLKYASDTLGSLDLTPDIILCKSLGALGVKAELKGANWDKIKELHGKAEWLKLISFVHTGEYEEFPGNYVIEDAARRIMGRKLHIYLLFGEGGKFEASRKKPISVIGFDALRGRHFSRGYSDLGLNYYGDPIMHPDGIGYVLSYRLSYGDCVVLYNITEYRSKYEKLFAPVNSELQALQKKVDLGEVSRDAYNKRHEELHQKTWAVFFAWLKTL